MVEVSIQAVSPALRFGCRGFGSRCISSRCSSFYGSRRFSRLFIGVDTAGKAKGQR